MITARVLLKQGREVELICLICGWSTHHQMDIKSRHCPVCHVFHSDPHAKVKMIQTCIQNLKAGGFTDEMIRRVMEENPHGFEQK